MLVDVGQGRLVLQQLPGLELTPYPFHHRADPFQSGQLGDDFEQLGAAHFQQGAGLALLGVLDLRETLERHAQQASHRLIHRRGAGGHRLFHPVRAQLGEGGAGLGALDPVAADAGEAQPQRLLEPAVGAPGLQA
ncbi:hypothetical protein D3C85_1413670 [compost metagenome]